MVASVCESGPNGTVVRGEPPRAENECEVGDEEDDRAVVDRGRGAPLREQLKCADRTSIDRWQAGAGIREVETEKRLRAAYQIATLLLPQENEHTVRAWFIGMNPQLNDEAPADAIREGRLNEALLAAKSFMLGG